VTNVFTCRSIKPEAWARAREALVFYFSRRHGSNRAQDLAQDTLANVWSRADYEFEKEEDFLRVCLGFARMISHTGYRQAQRDAEHVALVGEAPSPGHHSASARATEERILLQQICALGETQLRQQDWQLVVQAATEDGPIEGLSPPERNRLRVALHRARQKLEKVAGWKREENDGSLKKRSEEL
jgi:hypothetical protein